MTILIGLITFGAYHSVQTSHHKQVEQEKGKMSFQLLKLLKQYNL